MRSATNAGTLTDMFVIRGDGNPCVVVNDSGRADVDFRVETDTQSSAFLMDASANTATFNVPVTAAATSISAGTTVSAGTSVSATTTVTAGTIVQAPTITSDEKLIVSRGNTFGAGVVSLATEDLTTLGFGANLPGSVIIKGGVGTTLICDNIALGAIDDGTRFTVTASEAPVSVVFETPIGGGAIASYDLPNVGDAVTVQKCVAAAGWIIISTAGTAVKA